MEKSFFENKLKPALRYIGTIGAVLMSIAYIIIIMIFILGFKVETELTSNIVFAIINALVGIVIMELLKIQGIDFAKDLPENKEILKQYYNTQTKDKKPHSLKYYWITSVIKDITIKGLSFAISTVGLIYIAVKGNGDFNFILLAIVNLFMFVCFGFLALVKAYDFFNEQHIPYIKIQLEGEKDVRNSKEWGNNNPQESTGTSSEE